MITSLRPMQPLPVRPVDGDVRTPARVTQVRAGAAPMQPLPHLTERTDLGCAIRGAAFERMLDRLGIKEPLPIDDPTA